MIKKTSHLLSTLFLVAFIVFNGCKKDDPETKPQEEITASGLEKTSAKPGEAITIIFSEKLQQQSYTGKINDNDLQMSGLGKHLSFIVPQYDPGVYTITVNANGRDHSYNLEILQGVKVQNPEVYITDYIAETEKSKDEYKIFIDSLVANGIIDANTAQQDFSAWERIAQKAKNELAVMTPAQKQELADILEANKEWINSIDDMIMGDYFSLNKTGGKEKCQEIIDKGKEQNSNGKFFAASKSIISSYFCIAGVYLDKKTDGHLSKATALLDIPAHVSFFEMTVGRKIDKLSKEIDRMLGNSPSIADAIIDYGLNKKAGTIVFSNGIPKSLFVKIKFRTLRSSDAGSNTNYAPFAAFYNDFITSYDDFIKQLTEPLIWRPGYNEKTRVIDFNRDLSIPNSSITNNKVMLINTLGRDEKWEVAFATDDKTESEQLFNFDIVYDDGYAKLKKTFDAKVLVDAKPFSLIGTWEATEFQGLPMGTWIKYYEQSCPGIPYSEWARIFQRYIFTENELTFVLNAKAKAYDYKNLDLSACTYDDVHISDPIDENLSWLGAYEFTGGVISYIVDQRKYNLAVEVIDNNTIRLTGKDFTGGNLQDIYKRK